MLRIKNLILLFFFIASSIAAAKPFSQVYSTSNVPSELIYQLDSCIVELPGNSMWSGETKEGVANTFGRTTNGHLQKISDLEYKISDFSAGLFDAFGMGIAYEARLLFDCDKNIQPSSFITDWGEVSITGEMWDESEQELTIHWEIPFNQIVETSVFTVNN